MKSVLNIVLLAVCGGLVAMSPLAISWEDSLYDQRMIWWVERHPRSEEIVLIGLDQPPRDYVCGSFSTRDQPTAHTPLAGILEALDTLSPKAVALAFHLPDCEALKHLGAKLAPLRNRGIPLVLIPPKPTSGERNIPRTLLLQSLHIEDDPDWYRVQYGDTLSMMAQRFRTTVATLKSLNLLSDDTIHIGQRLRVSQRAEGLSSPLPAMHMTAIGSLQVKTHTAPDGVLRTVAWSGSSVPPVGSVLADLLSPGGDTPTDSTLRLRSGIPENRTWHIAYSEPWDVTPRPFHYQSLDNFSALDERAKEVLITDKVVILFDATEEFQVRTPRGERVPRAYIHAQLLLNRLTGMTITTAPPWQTVCLVLLGSVAMVSLYRFKHYRRWSDSTPAVIWLYPLGWALLLVLIYGLGQYKAFLMAQYMVPVIPPLVAIGIAAIGVAILTWQQSFARLASRMEGMQSERDVMLDERARLLETAEGNTEEVLEMNRQLHEKDAAILLLKVEQERQKNIQRQFLPHTVALTPLQDADMAALQQQAAAVGILTRDEGMLRAFHQLQQLANIPKAPVYIFGETGTGKERYAKALHRLSARAKGPFETINMGELTGDKLLARLFGQEKGGFTGIESRQGLFHLADQGTLFLDEIANLDMEGQRQILRVLEDGSFTPLGGRAAVVTDVRLVIATNKNLKKEWAAGRFMEDLYHRLTRGGIIRLIPLRNRAKDDLQLLAESLLTNHCQTISRLPVPRLTEEARDWILTQPWPGNVRELDGVLFRSLLANPNALTIQQEHLVHAVDTDVTPAPGEHAAPPTGPALSPVVPDPFTTPMSDEQFMELFCQYQGAIGEVAEHLGLHRDRVRLRVKGLALEAICQGEGPNHEQSCERMLRGHSLSRASRRKLEKKLQGYWETLVKTCQDWTSPEDVKTAIWQQNENMPSRKHYLRDLDAFIQRHYVSLTKP